MRQEILDYCQTLNLGAVTVSTELPWDENDVPLYVKNLKKVYVSTEDRVIEPILNTLDGVSISNETTSVRVYFACDAKTLLPNYQDVITDLKTARNITTIDGVKNRQCDVSSTTENDVLITELEYRFISIAT